MSALASPSQRYVGRFAPSPTGPLHFGSLIAALGSFLDARSEAGIWLLRIEDLDPPREQAGAADAILASLDAHGLHWDHSVVYQSQRLHKYEEALEQLRQKKLVYPCSCTRQMLTAMGGLYSNHCRSYPPKSSISSALRVKTSDLPSTFREAERTIEFVDRCFGPQRENLAETAGDFILKRKDGLIAYQLAVVVDDCDAGITHIVRGADLLSSTSRQLFLYRLFSAKQPAYLHLPLVLGSDGQKLSKQNHAPQLENKNAANNLWQALKFLGQQPPNDLKNCSAKEIVEWAVANWQLQRIPQQEAAYIKPANTNQ